MKYLYVEFSDKQSVIQTLINTGITLPETKRVVKIALTKSQVKELAPNQIGMRRGNEPYYESLRIIGIQDDT